MESLKIKVDGLIVARVAQELLELLGYRKVLCKDYTDYVVTALKGTDWYSSGAQELYWNINNCRLVTIPELRDMVVLHRSDVNDATHILSNGEFIYKDSKDNYSVMFNEKWSYIPIDNELYSNHIKPIIKDTAMQKEYLQELENGTYKLVVLDSVIDGHEGLIEVPEGADTAILYHSTEKLYFWKNNIFHWRDESWVDCTINKDITTNGEFLSTWDDHCIIAWQRHTQPEELPFFDSTVSYDDSVVNIDTSVGYDLDNLGKQLGAFPRYKGQSCEEYRSYLKSDISVGIGFVESYSDKQVGGSHYKDMAIQPVEFALANKLDFCQGNVVKYVLRHDEKNGREDLEKAKHYIDLMIEHHYPSE